jgi:hypothetical protein
MVRTHKPPTVKSLEEIQDLIQRFAATVPAIPFMELSLDQIDEFKRSLIDTCGTVDQLIAAKRKP